ncbi:hypothetical protein [Flavobacterium muglaense]|uniref:Uncharacterized protein n=1 Tax=Flavobacterium muglaense TaxID=2764716 RepID=A0A923MVZ2_9FLAO|nr:hypothetical protein [Flavobacterium muglaense]MBC5836792.1 hypothetical protein [Flavobacterium muglaense]MBC5843258.1 hypothetical protein [Flavobacterium muglaense]
MNNERLNELLTKEYSTLSTNEKSEITKFYVDLHKIKGCKSCKDKSEMYYNKLKNDSLKTLKISIDNIELNEGSFKLRTNLGVTKILFDNGQYISFDECDNDVALGFLEANQNRISMFEKYPENWKELITKMNNKME